jgi:two-component sensor histidine kinase
MTETHHRVKNNLQIISALIDMQRDTNEPMVPVTEFSRLSANVRALAVVHDILTQEAKAGSSQETLSVKGVLEKLLKGIEQIAGGHSLAAAIDDARLPGRQTTTLALVTNELAANAIKHGKLRTEVRFTVNGNSATLAVADDGPGFPAAFDPTTAANTGLELVENIVRWDLHGEITYVNRPNGGALVTVTFPISREGTG